MENNVLNFKKKVIVYYISDHCVFCWDCFDVCPEKAIYEDSDQTNFRHSVSVLKIDEKRCTSCGKCKEICPMDAIREKAKLKSIKD